MLTKTSLCSCFIFAVFVTPAIAAIPVDLSKQNTQFLKLIEIPTGLSPSSKASVKEISHAVDFNQTTHIRLKQTYSGYPVWGGDGVVHITKNAANRRARSNGSGVANKTMNGTFYEALDKDLMNPPANIFSAEYADKMLKKAMDQYKAGKSSVEHLIQSKQSQLIVYVDKNNTAHWAFHISFYIKSNTTRPTQPSYIIDALNDHVYAAWDEVKSLDHVKGGGFGGNKKMGKLVYDGLKGNLPALDITRDPAQETCTLTNDEVTVTDYRTNQFVSFSCKTSDESHDNCYWDGDNDHINGAYSPSNDALYSGKIINAMYRTWYGFTALSKDNQPMVLSMVTHSPNIDAEGKPDPDNALWIPEEQKMFFGDGKDFFYPLTSLGVAAHEISHGFTEQHSQLVYYDAQSGGMNESFSDMAAQAAEFFSQGHNSWQIGPEVMKEDRALRYMDDPTKDCHRGNPMCSIANVKDYKDDLDVHYTSGIYNRVFYLMATTPGWDVKKAFDVMVQANQHYWVPTSTFVQAACGVLKATKDYNYDVNAVVKAFTDVGLDTSAC